MARHRFPEPLRRLVNEFSKLPTIGEKTALKLAYHLVVTKREGSGALVDALQTASQEVGLCENCFFLSEGPLCTICQDESRDKNLVCVVERPVDALAIERTGRFNGLFHVLHSLWSPSKGRSTESMNLDRLLERLSENASNSSGLSDKEVLIATSTTVEGDATALYIANLISESLSEVKVSRIAQGMPMGGELEFADEMTLSHAIQGRRQIE